MPWGAEMIVRLLGSMSVIESAVYSSTPPLWHNTTGDHLILFQFWLLREWNFCQAILNVLQFYQYVINLDYPITAGVQNVFYTKKMTQKSLISTELIPGLENALNDPKIKLFAVRPKCQANHLICLQMWYFGTQRSFGAITAAQTVLGPISFFFIYIAILLKHLRVHLIQKIPRWYDIVSWGML